MMKAATMKRSLIYIGLLASVLCLAATSYTGIIEGLHIENGGWIGKQARDPNFVWDHDANSITANTDKFVIQPSADSTTGVQIMDTDGGTPILNTDTINERVGIRTTGPVSTLHVATGNISQGAAADNYNLNLYGTTYTYFGMNTGGTGTSSTRGFQFGYEDTAGTYQGANLINRENNPMHFWTNNLERITILGSGPVGLRTTDPNASLTLAITDTNDANARTADAAGFYATNVGASAEMYAIDEGGTASLLTDDFEEIHYDPNQGTYIPTARIKENYYAGIRQRLDLWKLARTVERLTGEKIITIEPLPIAKRRSWDGDQELLKIKRDKQITEAQDRKAELQKEIATLQTDPKADPNAVAAKVKEYDKFQIPKSYTKRPEPVWIRSVRESLN